MGSFPDEKLYLKTFSKCSDLTTKLVISINLRKNVRVKGPISHVGKCLQPIWHARMHTQIGMIPFIHNTYKTLGHIEENGLLQFATPKSVEEPYQI